MPELTDDQKKSLTEAVNQNSWPAIAKAIKMISGNSYLVKAFVLDLLNKQWQAGHHSDASEFLAKRLEEELASL